MTSGFDYLKKPNPFLKAHQQQLVNSLVEQEEVRRKLLANGFTQTGPDEFEKVHKQELIEQPKNWNEAIQELAAKSEETAKLWPGKVADSKAIAAAIEVRGIVNHYVDTGVIEYVDDEPKETFIGYQDAANYVLLSGPYEAHELTAFTMGKAWARFGKDTSLTMSFPLDKRDYKRLTTFSVPTSAKRKGAYGKL